MRLNLGLKTSTVLICWVPYLWPMVKSLPDLSNFPVNSDFCHPGFRTQRTEAANGRGDQQEVSFQVGSKQQRVDEAGSSGMRSSSTSHNSIEIWWNMCTHPFTLCHYVFVKLSMFIPFSCSIHCCSLNPASHQRTFLVLPPKRADPNDNLVCLKPESYALYFQPPSPQMWLSNRFC